jgi:putative Ca2+/H+ antiporter (TMEM165/GDT1 family)
MSTQILLLHQGRSIMRDEWRLQWRSWGTWLLALFYLAVVLSEHPVFSIDAYSLRETAAIWADRTALIGSLVAMLTVPFALDRVRRQHVAPIEFSKPFEHLTYVTGKLAGAALPLMMMTLLGMVIHAIMTIATNDIGDGTQLATVYLGQAILIAFPPLIFATAVTYCLSVFIRRPIIIIPLYFSYLMATAVSQQSADINFSWISPIVRPDYFNYQIPPEMMPRVIAHQLLYLMFSLTLMLLATRGFQRHRFIDTGRKTTLWSQIRFPAWPSSTVQLRLLWGGHIVAAFLFALWTLGNVLSFTQSVGVSRAEYAVFNLEFYLSLTGLFILTGVLARDQRMRVLELVLTKPINRWRLLAKRLMPALALYTIVVLLMVALLHFTYQSLPVVKAICASLATGIYLGLVGMSVANLTRNPLAGYGFGLIYWFLEAGFAGRYTAPFFLFIISHQPALEAGEIWHHPTIWIPSKLGLMILSLWLFVLNGWLIDAGSGRRRALVAIGLSMPAVFLAGWQLIPLLWR